MPWIFRNSAFNLCLLKSLTPFWNVETLFRSDSFSAFNFCISLQLREFARLILFLALILGSKKGNFILRPSVGNLDLVSLSSTSIVSTWLCSGCFSGARFLLWCSIKRLINVLSTFCSRGIFDGFQKGMQLSITNIRQS